MVIFTFIAEIATVAGLAKWVIEPGPWRPRKVRLVELMDLLPEGTLSSFIAMHIEHPGFLQAAPASVNILSNPSASACFFTDSDPGTMNRFTFRATFFPFKILAAILRSCNLPLVQEPMNAQSISVPSSSSMFSFST